MDHAHRIDRGFSRPDGVLPVALLLAIAATALGGLALLHGLSGTRPEPGSDKSARDKSSQPLRPRSDSSVLVLNGNGIAGAAGGVSGRLLADGYRSAPAVNAPVTTYARSVVLYRRGWRNEARRLAKDTRIRVVAPLDGALPLGYGSARLVVIVGH